MPPPPPTKPNPPAKLHHTNIVPVYATGEQDQTYFYAMELIDGPSLDHLIRRLREAKKGPSSNMPPGGQETVKRMLLLWPGLRLEPRLLAPMEKGLDLAAMDSRAKARHKIAARIIA